jgi:DNA-binding IclR family transcriptional regulator
LSELNSLERVLALLDVFTEERLEWTPEELMAELGYSRPTLYRYLKTLKEAGFLTSMPTGGFTLGPRVVEMDFLMRKSDRLVSTPSPGWNHSPPNIPAPRCWCAGTATSLVVASECTTPDHENEYPRGRPLPLARGAISRAIMAYMTRRKLQAHIEANLSELAEIGLGSSSRGRDGRIAQGPPARLRVFPWRRHAGVTGIASPIFDGGSSPVATFCITIYTERTTPELIDRIGRRVCEVSADLSARLAENRRSPPAPDVARKRGRKPPSQKSIRKSDHASSAGALSDGAPAIASMRQREVASDSIAEIENTKAPATWCASPPETASSTVVREDRRRRVEAALADRPPALVRGDMRDQPRIGGPLRTAGRRQIEIGRMKQVKTSRRQSALPSALAASSASRRRCASVSARRATMVA